MDEPEEDLGCMHLIYPKSSCTICNPTFQIIIVDNTKEKDEHKGGD